MAWRDGCSPPWREKACSDLDFGGLTGADRDTGEVRGSRGQCPAWAGGGRCHAGGGS